MLEQQFRVFLETYSENADRKLTPKSIDSRMSKGRKAEDILGYSFDVAVANDDTMYDALIALQPFENPKHNPMQNVLRKYYIFKHGKAFPQLRYYRR